MSAGNKCFLRIGHHWMWRRLAGTLSPPSLVVFSRHAHLPPGVPTGSNEEPWRAGTDPNLALAQERIINVTVFSLICSYLVLTHFHTPYELAISPPPNLLLLSPISILCQFRYHITTRLFALPELIIAQRKQYVALPLPLQPSSR